MRIRILTENTVYKRGLLGEHGLSLLIEQDGKRFLFDTGQTDVYVKNAKRLKEDLSHLDGIIFSHGHYDHCGGLEFFPEEVEMPPVYIRENAFEDKRHRRKTNYEVIGIDWKKEKIEKVMVPTKSVHKICDGFTLLGAIGYETDFEEKPEGFFIGEGMREDLMEDEQILVVETEEGLCLFMGCSHMGIINCIKRVEKEFPNRHIHSIFAGMHLKGVSKKRLDRTIEELEKIDFDYLIPVHCTGMNAIAKMKEVFGERCILGEVGKKIEL